MLLHFGEVLSRDMTLLDPAIFPSQPSDINGCWSGSTTILDGNKPVILYTGVFFFEMTNIINQRARARCTNKLGWRKKITTRGNRLP
jgi:sucrose-6-phosphate hydrolase SacC (GH32 family)